MEFVPSVGRVVLVTGVSSNGVDVQPAIITRVWNPDCVNVMVLPDSGSPHPRTSIQARTPERVAANPNGVYFYDPREGA